MLRNFGTVAPDFSKNSAKSCARLQRKKVMKARGAGKKFHEIIARNVEGGRIPPPPPALLGLIVCF